MAASNNVFALMDSITAQVYAVIVDHSHPPGVGSPNNAYWANSITTVTGNPIVAVPMTAAAYNLLNATTVLSTLATLFSTVAIALS